MASYKALICARGGSKGIVKKNIKPFCGKPLIAHTIELALSIEVFDGVIVSTDDENIASIALDHGASVPFIRPAELASDTAREWDVWRHCLHHLAETDQQTDALVILPPTSPLRTVNNVLDSMSIFEQGDCDGVFCVTEAHRNPEFNMVRIRDDNSAEIAIKGQPGINRRQDAPAYYDMTTVCYIMKTEFIMQADRMMDGKMRANIVAPENAVDIDTPLDFKWAEFLAMNKVAENS